MGLLNPLGYDVDFLSHEDRGTMTGVLNTVLLQNKSSGRGKHRQISGIEKAKENLKRGRLDGKDMKALIENAADRMARSDEDSGLNRHRETFPWDPRMNRKPGGTKVRFGRRLHTGNLSIMAREAVKLALDTDAADKAEETRVPEPADKLDDPAAELTDEDIRIIIPAMARHIRRLEYLDLQREHPDIK